MTFDHTAGVAAAEAILVRRVTACMADGLHALGGHCDACGVTGKGPGAPAHQHEPWQIRRKPGGGRYCAACGETTSERTER